MFSVPMKFKALAGLTILSALKDSGVCFLRFGFRRSQPVKCSACFRDESTYVLTMLPLL